MNEPITFTATIPVWFSGASEMDRIFRRLEKGEFNEAADALNFTASEMGNLPNPWVRAGDAFVTVKLKPRDQIAIGFVEALKQELQLERAESMRRQNSLLEQISKLQALEYTPPA